MSTREFERNADDFIPYQIQVFRRVLGAEELADSIRGLAKTILSESKTVMLVIDGEDQGVGSGYPYAKADDADELKLVYFERRTIPEVSKSGTFRGVIDSLAKGVPLPDRIKGKNVLQHNPVPSLSEAMDMVTVEEGYEPGGTIADSITLNTIAITQNPDIKTGSFLYDIVLQPLPTTQSNLLAYKHAKEIFGLAYGHARKAVYPTAPNLLGMKIASVRTMDGMSDRQLRFFEHVMKLIKTNPSFKLGGFEPR